MKTCFMSSKRFRFNVWWWLTAVPLLAAPCEASLNVVGYYNVPVTNGYYLMVNQLSNGNNSITNVLMSPPDGTKVYMWDLGNQAFTAPSTYSASSDTWDINYRLSVGTGFVMQVSRPAMITFVGEVPQGWLTNYVAGGNRFTLIGSRVPQGADLTTLVFPRLDGLNASLFESGSQSFVDAYSYFQGYGWFDPRGLAAPGGPLVNVGQSFFVWNPNPATNWIRYFIVQLAAQKNAVAGGPSVASIAAGPSGVSLNVVNPGGRSYDVQFSKDGITWSTVATAQTGPVWKGPWLGGVQGYYQVIQP
jgi:hypothetical protein